MTSLIVTRGEELARQLIDWLGPDLTQLRSPLEAYEAWVKETQNSFEAEPLELQVSLWCTLTAAAAKVMAQLIADSIDAEDQGDEERRLAINLVGLRLQAATAVFCEHDPVGTLAGTAS